jgi:ribonuclease VapC
MVLDTSAIIAAITNEEDSSRFRAAMLGAESLLISSVAVLETRLVLFARLGLDAVGLFEELLENAGMVPFDDEMARAAFDAFRRFGKGQGQAAQLNIVDCPVYALAKVVPSPSSSRVTILTGRILIPPSFDGRERRDAGA